MPAVMNAANEVAVYGFLNRQVGFLDIARLVHTVMDNHQPSASPGLEEILASDQWARDFCFKLITKGDSK